MAREVRDLSLDGLAADGYAFALRRAFDDHAAIRLEVLRLATLLREVDADAGARRDGGGKRGRTRRDHRR